MLQSRPKPTAASSLNSSAGRVGRSDDYAELFDFDPPAAKRAAFAKIRGDILRQRLADSANPLPAPGRACPDSIGGSVSVSEPG